MTLVDETSAGALDTVPSDDGARRTDGGPSRRISRRVAERRRLAFAVFASGGAGDRSEAGDLGDSLRPDRRRIRCLESPGERRHCQPVRRRRLPSRRGYLIGNQARYRSPMWRKGFLSVCGYCAGARTSSLPLPRGAPGGYPNLLCQAACRFEACSKGTRHPEPPHDPPRFAAFRDTTGPPGKAWAQR